MQYRDEGYLPEALLNYLARLGWSHGNEEKFSREQLVEWFDLEHISKSPARFDPEKLGWLNQQYLKETDDARLAELMTPFLEADGCDLKDGPPLAAVPRCSRNASTPSRNWPMPRSISTARSNRRWNCGSSTTLPRSGRRSPICSSAWRRSNGTARRNQRAIKAVVAAHGLKLPKIAMPLRVMVTGEAQTPSIDATLELIGRDQVLARLARELQAFP